MGRISVLLPTEEMVHLSHNILQEGRFSDIQEVLQVSTEEAVSQARQAAARGASILVARGLQAALIKRHTSIPVVEIVISAQEMALLIQRARQLIPKECPTIAVAGNQNMFCDMSRFEDIFHINLQLFLAQDDEDLERKAQEAVQSGADLLIGGNTVIAGGQGSRDSVSVSLQHRGFHPHRLSSGPKIWIRPFRTRSAARRRWMCF